MFPIFDLYLVTKRKLMNLFPKGEQIHEFMLGDQVWVKDWKHDLLAPR